jgi:hypothetical protein
VAFTLAFFVIFEVSERINHRRKGAAAHIEMDQFQLHPEAEISGGTLHVRPGSVLCLVRGVNHLEHLVKALELTHTGKRNLVVMTVRIARGPDAGYQDLDAQRLFSTYEQQLFTRVVAVAEKFGKHVDLLVIPSTDIYQAAVMTAAQLESWDIFSGISEVMTLEEQARRMGEAWESLTEKPPHPVRYRIVDSTREVQDFFLGAHAPALTDKDVNLLHRLWQDVTSQPGGAGVHHRDVVSVALRHLAQELTGPQRDLLLAQCGVRTSLPSPTNGAAASRLMSQPEARRETTGATKA